MAEALFTSAHAALTFAHNFSRGSLDRPTMAKMADKRIGGSGKGLGGLDGAAQAGFILREMQDLSRLHQQILLARFLPRTAECPCCGHAVPAHDWLAAVREVSDGAMLAGILSGHMVNRAVRDGIVARHFGQKVQLGDLAKRGNIHVNTVTDQNGKIVLWLRGSRLTKRGRGEFDAGVQGEEGRAMEQATGRLERAGIIGEEIAA